MEGGQLFHQLREDYSSLSERLRNWMEAEKIEGSRFKRDQEIKLSTFGYELGRDEDEDIIFKRRFDG